MVDIRQVIAALRLRRHLLLVQHDMHPLHNLFQCLIDVDDYIGDKLELEIDEVAKLNLVILKNKRLRDYMAPEWQLENDLILQASLLTTKIENLIRPRKLGGTEMRNLKRNGIFTLQDAVIDAIPFLARSGLYY